MRRTRRTRRDPPAASALRRAETRDLASSPTQQRNGARAHRILPEGKQRRVRQTATKEQGNKTKLTELRRALIVKTGMLPLDFLTAVYRDDLWSNYERVPTPDGRSWYWIPAKDAVKIKVDLDQRIRCAADAAPYMHRKMPQGIEVDDRHGKLVTAEQLKTLPEKDLLLLTAVFERLDKTDAPASLKGAALRGARTFTQDGEEIRP